MTSSLNVCGILVVVGLLVSWFNVAESQTRSCTPESGCRLKLSSGETLDFCATFNNGAVRWEGSDDIYEYNGKDGVECDPMYPGQAICLGFPGSLILIGVGVRTNVACSVVSAGDSPTITVVYNGGENDRIAQVTVYFEQGRLEANFAFQSLDDDNRRYSFSYHVPRDSGAGAGSGVDPGVPGIIILILLLVAVVAYIVIGVLVMRFYKGATGIEMIPNLSFWKDFPFLLKDGFVFTFTAWPCCPHSQSKGFGGGKS